MMPWPQNLLKGHNQPRNCQTNTRPASLRTIVSSFMADSGSDTAANAGAGGRTPAVYA